MTHVYTILKRIFADENIPTDCSKEEFRTRFEKAVTKFEEDGFLEKTALTPIFADEQLQEVLHRHRRELVVVKFWKKNCLPCLSMAEMYKEAEKISFIEKLPVHFYSVDIKDPQNRKLSDYQLVEGTPTVQIFSGSKQIGGEVRATNLTAFLQDIKNNLHAIISACPRE